MPYKYEKVYVKPIKPKIYKSKVYKKYNTNHKKSGRSEEDKAMSEGIDFMMKGLSLSIEIIFKLFMAIINGFINGIKYCFKKRKDKGE